MKTPPPPRCARPSPYPRTPRSPPQHARRWGTPNIQQSTPGPSTPAWKLPRWPLFDLTSDIDSDSEPDDLEKAGVPRIIKRARKPSNGIEIDVNMTSEDQRTFIPDTSIFGNEPQVEQVQQPSPISAKSDSTSAVEALVASQRASQQRRGAESPVCIVLDDSDSDEDHTQYHTPLRNREPSRAAPSASAAPRPQHTPVREKSSSRLRRDSSEIVSISDVFPPPPRTRRVIDLSHDVEGAEERAKLFKENHRKAAHILGLEVCKQIVRLRLTTSVRTAVGGDGLKHMKWIEMCYLVGSEQKHWNHVRTIDRWCGEQLLEGDLGWKGVLRELGFEVAGMELRA